MARRKKSSCSPHNRITREQAGLLQSCLDGMAGAFACSFTVQAACSVSDPAVGAVIDETAGYDARIIISMSPVDHDLTCGQLFRHLAETRYPDQRARVKVLSRFRSDPEL
jgi:protoheme ferro-lyase